MSKSELKKLIKEAIISVLTERTDLVENAVSEAILDMKLGLVIEEGDSGEYVLESEIMKKLTYWSMKILYQIPVFVIGGWFFILEYLYFRLNERGKYGDNMMKNIKYVVYKEGKYYVSQCLNVDVSSFGETIDEAIASLKEAVSLYFENEDNSVDYQEIGETLLGEDVIRA